MKLLLIEDDQKAARSLQKGLREEGFVVDIAPDGHAGLDHVLTGGCDLVILDVSLPGMDGWSVLSELRSRGNPVPVVMLTARDALEDRVKGLSLGADDYVVKPFAFSELTARVRAVLRRGPAAEPRQGRYQGARLMADFEAVAIAVDGTPVRLTRREFELLQYLVQNKNRVVSRDRLLERVWGYERMVETRSVDVHIGRLRQKLRTAGHQIETVVGLGYRFVD